jgi:hypothetical protein
MFFNLSFFLEKNLILHDVIGQNPLHKYRTTRLEDVREFKTEDVDITFPANDSCDFGLKSLTYRTELQHIRIFDPQLAGDGALIPPTINGIKAFQKAQSEIMRKHRLKREHTRFSEQSLVNRVLSVVYYPIYAVKVEGAAGFNTLTVDGISGRVMRGKSEADSMQTAERYFNPDTKVNARTMGFILFRCPDCGWDLPFMPYSRVHVCEECKTAWTEQKGAFKRMPYDLILPPEGVKRDWFFMPFWKIRAEIDVTDFVVKTVRDFRRILPYAFSLKDDDPGRELYFYIPGLKMKSIKDFNELAAVITRCQPGLRLADKENFPRGSVAGSFVSAEDAFQMAKMTYLSLVPFRNKRARDYAQRAEIKLLDARLTYFPFFDDHLYFREPLTGAFFQKKTVALE